MNKKQLLFVDDEPENVQTVCDILSEADIIVHKVTTVGEAVSILQNHKIDLVITDIFIPMGPNSALVLGQRARKYEENLRHLGGIALLDEIDRLVSPPKVLAFTACTDYALIEILGENVVERVPKPSPVDTLLQAILRVIHPPKEWGN